jgi:hypothetical protein
MSDVLNLGAMNWFSVVDTMAIWLMVLVMMVVFGLMLYFIWDWTRWSVYVEILRQVGEPYVQVTRNKEGKVVSKEMKINYESSPHAGRIYQKKLKSGGSKEYFKIKGTTWDYLNHFGNNAFYFRKASWFGDFKKKGIKLFVHPEKGMVPMLLSNPGFELSGVTLNEVIGSISDSLYEREQLYGDDFWGKYGQIITISFLIGFLVIGMMFIIKYQDVFWANSMNALRITIDAVKETAAPALK